MRARVSVTVTERLEVVRAGWRGVTLRTPEGQEVHLRRGDVLDLRVTLDSDGDAPLRLAVDRPYEPTYELEA